MQIVPIFRGGAGKFSLGGALNWEYVYYCRDSANGECQRREKLGGSGDMLPQGKFENLNTLGCNLVQSEL